MQVPDFSNLTLLELLFVLITLPGMSLWAVIVSDYVRNLVGGANLSPTEGEIGAWLRRRSPLAMQWLVIALQILLPLVAYLILALAVDRSMLEVEQAYRFIRDLMIALGVGKIYYQVVKRAGASPVIENTTIVNPTLPILPGEIGPAEDEPSLDEKMRDLVGQPPDLAPDELEMQPLVRGPLPSNLRLIRGGAVRRIESRMQRQRNEALGANLGDAFRGRDQLTEFLRLIP